MKCVFTVTANGAGLTYQWQKNLVKLVGRYQTTIYHQSSGDGDDGFIPAL